MLMLGVIWFFVDGERGRVTMVLGLGLAIPGALTATHCTNSGADAESVA